MNKNVIKNFVGGLEIPYLVHFTRTSNLESIVKNGLLSRQRVDALGCGAIVNDELRLDNHRETISVSIAHPNDKMFYKYRQNDADWCVLGIKPCVMWESDCLFYKHNAADARVSRLPTNYLGSFESFKSMFDVEVGQNIRVEHCLKPFDPTDVQAEILVPDVIPFQHIFGVVVSSRLEKKKLNGVIDDAKIIINSPNKGMYATRLYRRKWQ